MKSFSIPPDTRDISPEVFDANGRMRVLPAAFWADKTPDERALFGHLNGIYSFPTTELVEHLRRIIGNRPAIEIGAGNGVLAEALGIPATDSRHQEEDHYRLYYRVSGQPIVPYGPNVEKMDARTAVRHYKPKVVVACWVTHKYDPRRHHAGGNEVGIDEADIIRRCSAYVLVGHDSPHRNKSIWGMKHTIDYPSYVYSRAREKGDFIAVWRNRR